jgi:hypothetical protein
MKTDVEGYLMAVTSRIATMIVMIAGPSSISKSRLIRLLGKIICEYNGFPSGPEYFKYINDKDKFVSGWFNFKTILVFDDVGNSLPGPDVMDTGNFLLKANNNTPHELLAATAEDKGKWFNNALLGIISTNNPTLYFREYSEVTSSQVRRIHLRIQAEVKPSTENEIRTVLNHS